MPSAGSALQEAVREGAACAAEKCLGDTPGLTRVNCGDEMPKV